MVSDRVRLIPGDCLRAMRLMAGLGIQVDSIVCDPPYHLASIVKRFGGDGAAAAKDRDGLYKRASGGFMGKKWDGIRADGTMIAFDPETWRLALAVLRPGGHLVAFGGTRGWHRMACAIEDAGFEIRDTVAWLYGSGFPKSHNVALALEATLCGRRDDDWFYRSDGAPMATEPPFRHPAADEWFGFGTALKPAFEPIVLARKPLGEKSVAANVLRHGTGAINVGACKIAGTKPVRENTAGEEGMFGMGSRLANGTTDEGRWPANVCHDASAEVEAAFASFGESKSARSDTPQPIKTSKGHKGGGFGNPDARKPQGHETHSQYVRGGVDDSGSASRFFYSAKAGPEDRFGSKHPTVKPVALIRWLQRLVTPPGGLTLDPFAGSGTAGVAALAEGMRAILIEAEPEYQADIRARLAWLAGDGRHALVERARHAAPEKTGHGDLPLFNIPEAAE